MCRLRVAKTFTVSHVVTVIGAREFARPSITSDFRDGTNFINLFKCSLSNVGDSWLCDNCRGNWNVQRHEEDVKRLHTDEV